jgi:hypothetical protein
VLARGQYEAFRAQHPGLALLNQTFLFAGYSRVGPNFREIFEEVAGLYEGGPWQAFALSVAPAPGKDNWRRSSRATAGPAPSHNRYLRVGCPGLSEARRPHDLNLPSRV